MPIIMVLVFIAAGSSATHDQNWWQLAWIVMAALWCDLYYQEKT